MGEERIARFTEAHTQAGNDGLVAWQNSFENPITQDFFANQ